MNVTNSILADVREALDLAPDGDEFNSEILMHINSALVKVNQNGVGNLVIVNDKTTTWQELMRPEQIFGNKSFQLVPLYVYLSTKLIFDPPPPSAVDVYSRNADELLWRLKIAYEIEVS